MASDRHRFGDLLTAGLPAANAAPLRGVDDWVRRHQKGPWRYLLACGCPVDVAEDLLQEALLAAMHKQVPRLDDRDAAAWLIGAVRLLWRAHLRKQGVFQRAMLARAALAERAMQQCAAVDDGDAFVAAVRACLDGIDGRARRAIELRYLADAPRETIAVALGLSQDGVKTLLRRTRALLRGCVLRRIAGQEPA